MASLHRIAPCFWFDDQAEAAANHYVGIFPNSRIVAVTKYGKAGFVIQGGPAGSVLTVVF
jgi:predicted 3-demethylubiquinone-9 3-methyltransferase (glyoxalase superfamily)